MLCFYYFSLSIIHELFKYVLQSSFFKKILVYNSFKNNDNSDFYLKEISIESDYLRLERSFKDHIIPTTFPLEGTLFTSSACPTMNVSRVGTFASSLNNMFQLPSTLILRYLSLTSNLNLPFHHKIIIACPVIKGPGKNSLCLSMKCKINFMTQRSRNLL